MASLQAKQGLPLGTQIVGWATLGKYCFCSLFLAAFARHWTRELDDSCDTRHRSTFLSNIVYENRHQLLAMGIFASNAQSLEDVLTVMEHPWRSFRAQSLCTRIWLGAFLIFCLPLALFAASVFAICFRVPFKLLFKSRKWWLAARDEAYWYDCTYASPRRKLIVHLQNEIAAAQLDGTAESMCEKGARAQKTSAWTKRTVTWIWTKNIYMPPLAILPRTLDLSRSMTSRYNSNQENRTSRHRHATSIDENFMDYTLSLVRHCISIAEDFDHV